MPKVTLNSPGWSFASVAPRPPSRGGRRDDALPLEKFPDAFLAEGATVAEELIAQPKRGTRGEAAEAGSLDFTYELDAGETAIVAVRHPSGALTFHTPVELSRLSRGGPAHARFRLPATPSREDGATRGVVSAAIKAVVIKIAKATIDKVVDLALPVLARKFEESSWKKKGLSEKWLRVTKEGLKAGKLAPGRPGTGERSLLLIHGTFSNAASAYGALVKTNFFDRVQPIYGDRMFAFDHFTLSRTPEENARQLLEGLPEHTTEFDVITHSRGGLVLRNLVERTAALGSVASRFRLGRAVLVASPNEGTPLATPHRWEATVGWVANLLELFPDNPFTTGAEFVANGIVWLASHASGGLPGLHSMDGDGPLIRELQSPPGPPPEKYSALVANYNPTAEVLARLFDTGVDQFFGSANDLVVPSEGGWRVDRSASPFIPGARIGCFGPGGNLSGNEITHVTFFSEPATADFLVAALSGKTQPLAPIDPAKPLPDRTLLRSGASPGVGRRARRTTTDRDQPDKAAPPPFSIAVVNGDLTFESLPLVLGHYRSSRLTGTEWFVDRIIGGAMRRSLELGVYPDAPRTNQIFRNMQAPPTKPWSKRTSKQERTSKPKPEAVIVVGLGSEGTLQAGALSSSVRQAVLAWAQRRSEYGDLGAAQVGPFELAATLIGSGGSGIGAGQSAQLVAQGVREANELLVRGVKENQPFAGVCHLRLVELYLNRASEAWRALRMQAEATPGLFTVAGAVVQGVGSLERTLDSGYRGANYDFITAETRQGPDGEVSIEYALNTSRARTEIRAQTTQAGLVRDLVASASSNEATDSNIGRCLFKLLIPIEMEPFLGGTAELQIELDKGTAPIPWELLDDASNDGTAEPWAIRTKLLRKLRTEEFRNQVVDAEPDGHVLVIGEPQCPDGYPRLPGAREEAVEVARALSAQGGGASLRVETLISDHPREPGPDEFSVVSTLLKRDWRLIHVAGHGALGSEDGKPGGVVLSEGNFLGPNEIKAMRQVPELVFINCCHLGAFGNARVLKAASTSSSGSYDRVKFAAGLAEELIKIGVRCVIAAGWAVNDDAAKAFATMFYNALLRRRRFIDAVDEARRAAYGFEGNTWAAYQCYGDPDWRLLRDGQDADCSSTPPPDEFAGVAAVSGVRLALETLIVELKYQEARPDYQLKRVKNLEKRWRENAWSPSGGTAELFAQAFAAVNDFPGAIRWYQRAIDTEDGNVSFFALEQHANLTVREAWRSVEQACDELTKEKRAGEPNRTGLGGEKKAKTANHIKTAQEKLDRTLGSARKAITGAMKTLGTLSEIRKTAERESLSGSAMKRLAQVEAAAGNGAAERTALKWMRTHYENAMNISRSEESSSFFYPAMNFIVADLALHPAGRGRALASNDVFDQARAGLEKKNEIDPDFWSFVGKTELKLFSAVGQGTLAREFEGILHGFEDLHRRMKGGTEWRSVYDTAEFVLGRYQRSAAPRERAAIDSLLKRLADLAGVER